MARFSLDVFQIGRRTGKMPLSGNISLLCIQNELVLARFARRVSDKPCKQPFGNTPSDNLATKGSLSRPRPPKSCIARISCQLQRHQTARVSWKQLGTPWRGATFLPLWTSTLKMRSNERRIRKRGARQCMKTGTYEIKSPFEKRNGWQWKRPAVSRADKQRQCPTHTRPRTIKRSQRLMSK